LEDLQDTQNSVPEKIKEWGLAGKKEGWDLCAKGGINLGGYG
jgi:hypothetical protein